MLGDASPMRDTRQLLQLHQTACCSHLAKPHTSFCLPVSAESNPLSLPELPPCSLVALPSQTQTQLCSTRFNCHLPDSSQLQGRKKGPFIFSPPPPSDSPSVKLAAARRALQHLANMERAQGRLVCCNHLLNWVMGRA